MDRNTDAECDIFVAIIVDELIWPQLDSLSETLSQLEVHLLSNLRNPPPFALSSAPHRGTRQTEPLETLTLKFTVHKKSAIVVKQLLEDFIGGKDSGLQASCVFEADAAYDIYRLSKPGTS